MAMLIKVNVKSNNLSRIERPRGPSSGLYSGKAVLRPFCGTFTRQRRSLTSETCAKARTVTYTEENPKVNDRNENPLGEYRS